MAASSKEHEIASTLRSGELIWRERYAMLESHGYRMRQRYKPDWKPTWLATNRPLHRHEDYQSQNSPNTMDAIRISDGRRVFLKRVPSDSSELVIHRFLSDPQRLQESDNHTAALVDEFTEEDNPRFTYMVLPLLRPFYHPEFFSVDEAVDFIRQLLQGIVYMHKRDVAHRDCSDLNIMMDAEPMYPKGFHPVSIIMDASGIKPAHPKRRRDVEGVRYYFIDFDISTKFGPGEERRVVGTFGGDDEVPELSKTEPYDPFFVDVFILGNFIKKRFLEKYTNFSFLEPLVEEMTEHDWRDRCTSARALRIFDDLVGQQSWYALRWRLKEKVTGPVTHFFQDVGTIWRESIFHAAARSERMVQFMQDSFKAKKSG